MTRSLFQAVLGQTQMATLISREGCCPVRIPVAERFSIHKLVVSQLRTNREAKTDKDIFQASVIMAALGEKYPGAIESAVMDLPTSARKYLVRVMARVMDRIQDHPRAAEEFSVAMAQIGQAANRGGAESKPESEHAVPSPAMPMTATVRSGSTE